MSPPFIDNICNIRKVVNYMRLRNVKNAHEILMDSFYFVENPKDYKKGVNDEKYYSEIWIPIKRK